MVKTTRSKDFNVRREIIVKQSLTVSSKSIFRLDGHYLRKVEGERYKEKVYSRTFCKKKQYFKTLLSRMEVVSLK